MQDSVLQRNKEFDVLFKDFRGTRTLLDQAGCSELSSMIFFNNFQNGCVRDTQNIIRSLETSIIPMYVFIH